MNVPKFDNEAQEADWWFENRELLSQEFEKAAAEGRLGHGSAARRAAAAEATIQLDAEDAVKARAVASRKGMQYQTYIKSIIHEALEKETAA